MKIHKINVLIALVATSAITPPAIAQNYELEIDNQGSTAVPVDQRNPSFPGSGIRSGQEGWVRVNFVITPAGQAIDPIIVDSVGGPGFEASVRDAVAEWTFEPSDEMRANNTTDIRFEIRRGRDMATSNFMRRYRRIVTHLHHEEVEEARAAVDQAAKIGGWNLYESTMLWLMVGRVEGAEGNRDGKLESYRRALGVSNTNSLDSEGRRELLPKLFVLEIEKKQYAAARRTLSALKRVRGTSELEALADEIAEMEHMLAGDDPIAAQATLFNTCSSDEGAPLWSYVPARRTFSFAALNGNVERFEVRCERERLKGLVEAGKSWSLPEGASSCQVFVFGEDGASFDFVEHHEAQVPDATGEAAVARSDVLD